MLTIGNAYIKVSIPRQVIGFSYEVSELCMSAGGVKGSPRPFLRKENYESK